MGGPVAIITVGQPRAVAHPSAAASFALMRSSLLGHRGSTVNHFMWLSEAPPPRNHRKQLTRTEKQALLWAQPLDRASQQWLNALAVYLPVRLIISNATLPCRPQCGLRCNVMAHDAPIEWMRQFFAVSRAWHLVLAYERDAMSGAAHSWYIKTRPDLLHLQPLVQLSSLDRGRVHVASGVMTSASRFQHYNDHIMLCATHALCEIYFLVVERTYATCAAGFKMPWPPQELYIRELQRLRAHAGTRGSTVLFQHAYTVVRPERGPECNRLWCKRADQFATGCVANHLPAAAPMCEGLNSTWREDQVAAMPSAAAQALFASGLVRTAS